MRIYTSTKANVKSIMLVLIAILTSTILFAQLSPDYCNGDPSDWANFRDNYPIRSYTHDIANATTAIDDNFKQAKDVNNISTWTWWLKGANDKGDITNAGAALIDGRYLRFFGDRTDNSGACNIGFWFLKNDVKAVDGKFTAGHAIGDLLVLVELNQGGTLATPKVYTWTAAGLTLNTTASSYACSGANQNTFPVPAGFDGYTNKNGNNEYLKNSFFEGAIDLQSAGLGSCFATFIVETRQSPSTTAALEDFAVGDFNATPDAPTAVNNSRCGTGTVVLTPSGCSGGVIQWYATATSTSTIHTGASFTTPSLTATTDYYISCLVGTCESPRVKITATINTAPDDATLNIIQPSCSRMLGQITITAPLGDDYRYSFNGGPYTTTLIYNFAAGAGYSIRVKNNATGCESGVVSCAADPDYVAPAAAVEPLKLMNQVQKVETYTAKIEAASKVSATPNPYNDKIRFVLESNISGQGSLELYNMMGQKVSTVYRGHVNKGQLQTVEYLVPTSQRSNLIWVFTVGNEKTSGKLIGIK